jgi:starvation-inducible outer membrane lipoprotein
MKHLAIASALLLSACVSSDPELQAHLETERDFAYHQYHVQQAIEKQYDPEYVDDCFYYEELICEFE